VLKTAAPTRSVSEKFSTPFAELIERYSSKVQVHRPFSYEKADARYFDQDDADSNEETKDSSNPSGSERDNSRWQPKEPNMHMVCQFDSMTSFKQAGNLMAREIEEKKYDFGRHFRLDFRAIVERGILIRAILLHLRSSGENPEGR
jgi:hypothetical protein